jgi:DNA (cytosine-5)-methyltransferase 1
MTTHLDIFSGIGGFALAARWAGFQTVGFCEINEFCKKVLTKHFPNVPIHDDVNTLKSGSIKEKIDIVTGGFPCTDLSACAKGSHKQLDGKESGLFWKLRDIVNSVKPKWVVIENVPSVSKHMDTIRKAMPEYEWENETFCSSEFGVLCRRKRTYIVGHLGIGRARMVLDLTKEHRKTVQGGGPKDVLPMLLPWKGGVSLERLGSCLVEVAEAHPNGIRTGNGIRNRMDGHRYLALGNSVTPKVIHCIFESIKQVENE